MNTENPGITGRELLEKLQELSPEDLDKRIVIGVEEVTDKGTVSLRNFSNGVKLELGTYCWGEWSPALYFKKHCEPCIKILSIIS